MEVQTRLRDRVWVACGAWALAVELSSGVAAALPCQKKVPFSHTRHVRQEWVGAKYRPNSGKTVDLEYDRDCRGCHDYSKPDVQVRPTELCNRCHFFQGPEYGGESRVGTEDLEGEFNHYEHRNSGCFLCHGVDQGRVPDSLQTNTGSAQTCAGCHGLEGRAKEARERFEDGLDRRLAGKMLTDKSFRHDQHLTRAELDSQDPKKCLECHAGLVTEETTSLAEAQFTVKRCEECHEGAEFETDVYEKPSRTAGTFLHKVHLGAAAKAERPKLAEKLCYACHQVAGTGFDLGPSFSSAGKPDPFKACSECHTEVARDHHGTADDCRKCHDFDGSAFGKPGEIWKQQRARRSVSRPLESTFTFGLQKHEFVTGSSIAPECSGCHRARLPASASRLDGKAFLHATHLTKASDDDAQECLKCHASMSTSNSPADLAFDPHAKEGKPLYELKACEVCHKFPSAGQLGVNPGASETRTVLSFSHATHLTSSKRKFACTDCHVVRGERIELTLEASECTQCHDHRRPDTTGGHSREAVEACGKCHAIGVPERGEKVEVERLKLARIAGERSHPSRPEQDCDSCHYALNTGGEKPTSTRERSIDYAMLRTRDIGTPHSNLQEPKNKDLPWAEDYFFLRQPIPGRATESGTTMCIDCHWGSWDTVSGSEPTLIDRQLGKLSESEWRALHGARLDAGFPGFDPTR